MTANAFEEDRKACLDAGMDEHIGKPIDIPLLKKDGYIGSVGYFDTVKYKMQKNRKEEWIKAGKNQRYYLQVYLQF